MVAPEPTELPAGPAPELSAHEVVLACMVALQENGSPEHVISRGADWGRRYNWCWCFFNGMVRANWHGDVDEFVRLCVDQLNCVDQLRRPGLPVPVPVHEREAVTRSPRTVEGSCTMPAVEALAVGGNGSGGDGDGGAGDGGGQLGGGGDGDGGGGDGSGGNGGGGDSGRSYVVACWRSRDAHLASSKALKRT